MKRLLFIAVLCAVFAGSGIAQDSDTHASREDVEKYLAAVHSHQMMQQMIDAMSKPMHQMIHEQFAKDRDRLPPDFEAKMNQTMDDMLKGIPFDKMEEAM